LATVRVGLFTSGDDAEKLIDLKAFTYNLENGKVISTKLDKNDQFRDKIDKNHIECKFTMPAVKAGSVIEYSYTVNSDFLFNMQPWTFQHMNYPCLWSEYQTIVPSLLLYTEARQGFYPFYINESKYGQETYIVTKPPGSALGEQEQRLSVASTTNIHRFVVKNIPAFKIEDYLTCAGNYIDRVEFQLAKVSNDGETYRDVMTDWPKTSEELLKREDFGYFLHDDNLFVGSDVARLTHGAGDKLQAAKTIYNYVKDNFVCTEDEGLTMSNSFRDILKKRKGNVADLNLLLIALLNQSGVRSDPVVLSTRDHGFNPFKYPILAKYNYVICKADVDGKTYYLDATNPLLGFGKLEFKCYNGEARLINSSAAAINLSSDSLTETKMTSVRMAINDKGEIVGSVQQFPGYFASMETRDKIEKQGEAQYFKELGKGNGMDLQIISPRVDSLHNLDEAIAISYDFKVSSTKENVIYINPMFGEGYQQNPFKSATRSYPIEMPYSSDETYLFNMIIPDGYVVDELPKSQIVKLNEAGDGQFDYRIAEFNGTISLRSRIQLKRTYYQSAEYDILREFFNMIVAKQNEQIVLKKKK
jgi:hypothetical protein